MIVARGKITPVMRPPYVGAPAYNAGLRPADVIVRSMKKATTGLTPVKLRIC